MLLNTLEPELLCGEDVRHARDMIHGIASDGAHCG
jgi:hypothetical protein